MKNQLVIALLSLFVFQLKAAPSPGFYLGLESGGILKHSISGSEDTGFGSELGIKALWSQPWHIWRLELAGGWRMDRVLEDEAKVATKAFFFDSSVQNMVSENFSIGPMMSMLVGRDVSFSDFGTNSDYKAMSLFAGVKLAYELPVSSISSRVGLQLQTDLNIGDRQITQAQVIIEIGLGSREKDHLYSVAEQSEPPPEMVSANAEIENEIQLDDEPEALPDQQTFNLTNSGINFELDSVQLKRKSKKLLSQLAKVLERHRQDWGALRISGHTDTLGSKDYNMKLSRVRAKVVRRELILKGLSSADIVAEGLGPLQPIDRRMTDRAHAKNRRVVLTIEGLEKDGSLVKKLNSILR